MGYLSYLPTPAKHQCRAMGGRSQEGHLARQAGERESKAALGTKLQKVASRHNRPVRTERPSEGSFRLSVSVLRTTSGQKLSLPPIS